jgi:ADP-ribose pyrophosphatase YjhB (NUDIX family)
MIDLDSISDALSDLNDSISDSDAGSDSDTGSISDSNSRYSNSDSKSDSEYNYNKKLSKSKSKKSKSVKAKSISKIKKNKSKYKFTDTYTDVGADTDSYSYTDSDTDEYTDYADTSSSSEVYTDIHMNLYGYLKCPDYKYKVLVIPYYKLKSGPIFLNVLGNQHNEWSFISGKIDNQETYKDAAIRELYEETRGIVDIEDFGAIKTFYIDIKETKFYICLKYKVFLFDLDKALWTNGMPLSPDKILQMYQKIKSVHDTDIKKYEHFNENSKIVFDNINSFKLKKNKWSFMDIIINHPEFKNGIQRI